MLALNLMPRRRIRPTRKQVEQMLRQKQPRKRRGAPWFLIFFLILLSLSFFIPTEVEEKEEVPLSTIIAEVNAEKVENLIIENDTLVRAELKKEFGGTILEAEKEPAASIYDYGITSKTTNIKVDNNAGGALALSVLLNFFPVIILIGFIWFIVRQSTAQNSRAMNFGRSKAKLGNTSKIRFSDVAGLKEAKEELSEIVEFLKNPKKFQAIGAEIPKGVILTGPPGTGKTLLAKAVAGEANVPFFLISASEFVEMFVGVGASRVRDLFNQAKKHSPAIIFIDELDAIGRQRGAGLGGSHDEREQTLNQILVEMDGFGTDVNVIVMAATNRPDILDPALLRPGRFDRKIVVDAPTKIEREEILKIHSANKPLEKEVDLAVIAGQTAGFSGADLKNVANEAAIFAARANRKTITQEDFHDAVEKLIIGPERSSRILSKIEKETTAIHEAGHAIVGHVLPLPDPIHKVSIISRGQALGVTWSLPQEDRHLTSKSKFIEEIAVLLGGRIAEELFTKEITTGASNDLQRATKIARAMVTQLGMSSKLGLRTYGDGDEMVFLGREIHESKNYSETVAKEIDVEVLKIVTEAEKLARKTLRKHSKQLKQLSDKLLKEETVQGSYLNRLIPQEK